MERIWNFFENMNEYVYVADADTHELVYMNKKMRDTYGIHSKEELAGKKCYELLQNSSLPCTICNNDELQEGQFKEWRYFNPLLNKYFKIKDTVVEDNGRRYRIEIALNISSQEHQKNVVRRYEKLEKIVNEGEHIFLSIMRMGTMTTLTSGLQMESSRRKIIYRTFHQNYVPTGIGIFKKIKTL